MADEKYTYKIDVETKDAIKSIKKISSGVDTFGASATKNFKGASQALNVFKGALASGVVLGAAKKIGGAIDGMARSIVGGSLESAKQIEGLSITFETLLGSASAAKDIIVELQEFSATTPFQLPGISKAAQQLLAFGFEADQITEKLKEIGDVAAGSGNQITDVSQIFGQVAAAGKLTGERLNQLQERAIPIGPAIAKTMGIAEKSLRGAVSAGLVTSEVFQKAFSSLSAEGGQFAGGMIRQSKTLDGVFSTLSDNIMLVQSIIGEGLLPGVKILAGEMISLVQNNKDAAKSFGGTLASGLVVALRSVGVLSQGIDVAARLIQGSFGVVSMTVNTMAAAITKAFEYILKALSSLSNAIPGLPNVFKKPLDKVALLSETLAESIQEDAMATQKAFTETGGISSFGIKIDELADKVEDAQRRAKESAQEAAKASEEGASRTVAAEQEKLTILQAIREQERLRLNEQKLLDELQKEESTQKEIDALKANRQKQFEVNKSFDDKEKALIDELSKKRVAAIQNQTKVAKKAEEEKLKKRAQVASASGALIDALSSASALAGRKSFGLTKGLALAAIPINTAAAIMAALTIPPPVGPIQATAAAVTGAVQLAKVSQSKPPAFESSGIVGGNTAATDSQLVSATKGEVILDEARQDNLARRLSANTQTVIVQIDGREIARAVRDQQEQGFQLA